jgi:DNA-binding response OmpR family regulator
MGKILVLSAKQLLKKREEKALTEAGWQVTTFSKYDETRLQTDCPNARVIVLDDTLRNVDVNETCRRLRASTKSTIILLGSLPPTAMWEKCREIGFDHYFKKPVSSRELAYQIKRLWSGLGPVQIRRNLNSFLSPPPKRKSM